MENKLAIAWCDNGMVDGKFMQGVTDVMIHSGVEVVTQRYVVKATRLLDSVTRLLTIGMTQPRLNGFCGLTQM